MTAGSPGDGPPGFTGDAVHGGAWARVANAMARKIHERQWKPGMRLPGAHEIARAFGNTGLIDARKAINELESKGLLRKEGKVYFVAEEEPPLFKGVLAWERAANLIAEKIRTGTWPGGTTVPSVRTLSRELEASPPTVRRALTEAAATGLMYRDGDIYVVREQSRQDPEPEAPAPAPEPAGADRAQAPRPEPADAERFLAGKRYMVEEIAAILDMSKMTVYRLIQEGELKAFRFRNALRITEYDLADYIRRSRFNPAEKIDFDSLAEE